MKTGSVADTAFSLHMAAPHLTRPEHQHSPGSAGLPASSKAHAEIPRAFFYEALLVVSLPIPAPVSQTLHFVLGHNPPEICFSQQLLPSQSPLPTQALPASRPPCSGSAPSCQEFPGVERGIGELFSMSSSCCLAACNNSTRALQASTPQPLCATATCLFEPCPCCGNNNRAFVSSVGTSLFQLSAIQPRDGLLGHGHTFVLQTAAAV